MCDYCAALTHTDTNKQTTPRPADKKHNASPHKARRSKSNIGLSEEMEENTMAGGEYQRQTGVCRTGKQHISYTLS